MASIEEQLKELKYFGERIQRMSTPGPFATHSQIRLLALTLEVLIDLVERLVRIDRLESAERRAIYMQLEHQSHLLHQIIRYLKIHDESPPAAGTLTGTFTPGVPMSSTKLDATLPTVRQDGSALDPTAIGSITYQKTSLVGSPPAPGPNQVLQTNEAQAGAGLQASDLTFTDTSPLPGDDYTFFVTDAQGHIGAASNDFVNPAQASPPAAGTLVGTFTP